jgi:hypothetical protein
MVRRVAIERTGKPIRAGMGFKVIEIQPTPNPNALKFVLDTPISEQPISFFNASSAAQHPLASRLFEIDGVMSLLLLGDFITINKSPGVRWDDIKRQAKAVLKTAS